ncbi:putative transposase, YhgA-like [Moorella thermoacetica]|nr:Rpn family recombination-promoting nuclease/putative transposase [Moorella thermoacetica]OIQ59998.1 putative transposase, YhgA-like [Moorella thermoacetica]
MPENEGQPRPPHHPYDKGYRQLLADKRVFLELLKTFVREAWVEAIDADDLILVNKSYVLQDFSEKEADVVYRLKTRNMLIVNRIDPLCANKIDPLGNKNNKLQVMRQRE